MGVDIYSYSGVVLTIDDMLSFVKDENRTKVLEACHTFYKDLYESVTPEQKSYEGYYSTMLEHFACLKDLDVESSSEICDILLQLTDTTGEGNEMEVIYSDAHLKLWRCIIKTSEAELPELTDIKVWGAPRYQGYDVPREVACFIFDKNECYETKLSIAGENLENIVGSFRVCDWTVYSY